MPTRKRRTAAEFVEPMKALGVSAIPPGPWLTELKFDGYRCLGLVSGGQASLWSRNRRELSEHYPELVAALRRLPCRSAVLDGEIAALDEKGRSRFQLLQRRDAAAGRPPIVYYLFDLLRRDGESLLARPIEERKVQLKRLLQGASPVLRLSAVLPSPPERVLAEAAKHGLEGVVLKRPGSVYEPGRRSGAWVKKRISLDQEFVIGGFTPPGGSRTHFGAILVGYWDAHGALHYAGKVGTGFNAKLLASLHRKFLAHAQEACPFAGLPQARKPRYGPGMTRAAMREVTWLKPRLVAQIKFSEWTGEGHLRQPVFLGLREDKRAAEVVRES